MSARAAAPGEARAQKRRRFVRRVLAVFAWLAPLGWPALACTLTRDDFEPDEVSSLGSDPGVSADMNGRSGNVGAAGGAAGCSSSDGCCASASECGDGEVCANGACVAACSAEDVSMCDVPLCPGPGCPDGSVSCSDGVRNGREPGVDCGGGCPQPCGTGSACNADGDCTSGRCVGSLCAAPTCDDGARNRDESGLDCGGSCDGCGAGQPCRRDEDCASGLFCPPATAVCTDASCQDGVQGGAEVLVDCGGGQCPGCPPGSPCASASDCDSRVCSGGACQPASCEDGAPSGDESGLDCGGSDPECPRCCDGAPCRGASDCESGACEGAVCVSCSDEVRNGAETDIDCGGGNPECGRCDDGAACALDDDCESERCLGGRCATPSCSDSLRNGSETDIDCGGSDPECPRCAAGESCSLDSDCASLNCDGQACGSCGDGVRNGAETDTDCGGADTACARCAPGDTCQVDSDCASGACQGGSCCGGSLGDCTRCAQRLSPAIDCNVPAEGVDATGVINCNAFLGCLAANAARCPTRNAPGCSGDNQATDACPHNDYGGNAGTGVSRATQVLINAGCQL